MEELQGGGHIRDDHGSLLLGEGQRGGAGSPPPPPPARLGRLPAAGDLRGPVALVAEALPVVLPPVDAELLLPDGGQAVVVLPGEGELPEGGGEGGEGWWGRG